MYLLAQKENVTEYLPCMCKMDHPKYRPIGAALERSKTLAAGDDGCDFHIVREKIAEGHEKRMHWKRGLFGEIEKD